MLLDFHKPIREIYFYNEDKDLYINNVKKLNPIVIIKYAVFIKQN